jgi:hypothetical protein
VKPSDHLLAGECPFCHGTGRRPELTLQLADPTIEDRLGVCPLCHGSAVWPPAELGP